MTESAAVIANGNVVSMTTELGKIGDYQLVRLLGSGGMGAVYFGVSPTADPVAIKVIKPHHRRHSRRAGASADDQ